MTIAIASWNLGRRAAPWRYLDERLRPDVALLQEAVVPPDRKHVVCRPGGISNGRRWGSVVATTGMPVAEVTTARSGQNRFPEELFRTYPGCIAIGRVEPPGREPFIAVSVYGLIDNGYATTTMQRVLSDLTPLLLSPSADCPGVSAVPRTPRPSR